MATSITPITPVQAPASTFPAWVITWEKFVKAHETLIIIIFAALLLWKFDTSLENVFLKHDVNRAQQAAIVVKTDDTANKALQDQLAQMKADADRQAATLNAQIDSQLAALKKQQAADAA